jgi:hypothetical protein
MTRQPARPVTGDDAAANGSGKVTRDVVLAASLEIIDRDGAGVGLAALMPALGLAEMLEVTAIHCAAGCSDPVTRSAGHRQPAAASRRPP